MKRVSAPWQTGWSAAAELRRIFGMAETDSPARALPDWLEARKCGWPKRFQAFEMPRPIGGIDTVHYHPGDRIPAVLTSVRSGPALRFRLARSLYHLFFRERPRAENRHGGLSLVPGIFSESNAFAAELLAPVAALREMTPEAGVGVRESSRLTQVAVSPKVIEHQVENRELGAVRSDSGGLAPLFLRCCAPPARLRRSTRRVRTRSSAAGLSLQ